MNLIGLMCVRNEAWCLGLSLRVALRYCDGVVVLNHASTDETPDIIAQCSRENPDRIRLLTVAGDSWDEMQHRQLMLDAARKWAKHPESRAAGATHIAMIDADEILTANLVDSVRALVGRHNNGTMVSLPGYNLRGGLDRYHADGIWGRRWFSFAFRDHSELGWRGDTFHSREPRGWPMHPIHAVQHGQGGILHLWGASEQRLRAKHALYKMVERIKYPAKPPSIIDDMYSWAIEGSVGRTAYGTPSTWTYADVPASWWGDYDRSLIDLDREPWQIAECARLMRLHGRDKFAGLDLFSVV